MKPERAFTPERMLAAHCPELLARGPAPDELLGLLGRMGDRLARRLAGALAPLLGGEAPRVDCAPPREGDYTHLRSSIAPLAANCLFGASTVGGTGAAPLLVSIEAEPVLRIVDHAFGGKGEAPCPLPSSFSMAADLMIGRIEGLLATHLTAAIAATSGAAPGALPVTLTPLRRDGSLAMLAPFAERAPLSILTLEVEDGSVLPWLVTIAMPMGTLAALFGYPDPTPGVQRGSQPPPQRQCRRCPLCRHSAGPACGDCRYADFLCRRRRAGAGTDPAGYRGPARTAAD